MTPVSIESMEVGTMAGISLELGKKMVSRVCAMCTYGNSQEQIQNSFLSVLEFLVCHLQRYKESKIALQKANEFVKVLKGLECPFSEQLEKIEAYCTEKIKVISLEN